ncbi:hypothetical protein ACFE04_015971 [Oxalis oulophora]
MQNYSWLLLMLIWFVFNNSAGERRGARLLEELKTSGIFCRESRGWTSAIVVKRGKGEKENTVGDQCKSVEVVAKEKKKQAEKSVEREAVATDNEVNLADNDSSWAFPGNGNVEQSTLPENLSGVGPEVATRAGEEPGTSSEHIIAPPRTGQTVGSSSNMRSEQTAPTKNVRSTSQQTGQSTAPTNNVRSRSQPTRPSNNVRSTSQPKTTSSSQGKEPTQNITKENEIWQQFKSSTEKQLKMKIKLEVDEENKRRSGKPQNKKFGLKIGNSQNTQLPAQPPFKNNVINVIPASNNVAQIAKIDQSFKKNVSNTSLPIEILSKR